MRRFNALGLRFDRAATADDVARVVDAHARAAELAADAGFDAVELHFGHDYLVSAFLSPRSTGATTSSAATRPPARRGGAARRRPPSASASATGSPSWPS